MVLTWVKYIGIFIGVAIVIAIAGVLVTQRVSDGPIEFLQGGPLRTGELVEEPVTDWSFGVGKSTEFELVGFGTSRVAGYIMHDGDAYMTCDLGFMWNRFEGQQRLILNLIYVFKRWHKDAVEDGRALLRIDGKLFKANFVKVVDPELDAVLRARLEDLAREYIAPAELGPPPAEEPNDVWFFRMDPR
ncbi:MAG: hypothetical protein O7F71_18955 [Gammaproteobacteria bacterium]|nr:hypothetical protein [Gammaproteobacteria bacterium]